MNQAHTLVFATKIVFSVHHAWSWLAQVCCRWRADVAIHQGLMAGVDLLSETRESLQAKCDLIWFHTANFWVSKKGSFPTGNVRAIFTRHLSRLLAWEIMLQFRSKVNLEVEKDNQLTQTMVGLRYCEGGRDTALFCTLRSCHFNIWRWWHFRLFLKTTSPLWSHEQPQRMSTGLGWWWWNKAV